MGRFDSSSLGFAACVSLFRADTMAGSHGRRRAGCVSFDAIDTPASSLISPKESRCLIRVVYINRVVGEDAPGCGWLGTGVDDEVTHKAALVLLVSVRR